MSETNGSSDDDDYDDLDIDLPESRSCDISETVYLKACRLFKVTPSSFFYRHLTSVAVPLQNHAIGANGAKALATAFVCNMHVQHLDLTCTRLGLTGLSYVLEMLDANATLTDLNLTGNELGSTGARQIAEAFQYNQRVKILDISDNQFRDDDALCLCEMLQDNMTLTEFKVRRNSFGENAGENFRKALENNSTLIHLDLSWNHFRQNGAINICQGLQSNNTLEVLNLSWNGFGLEGCHEMGKTLKVNRSLADLDLSANRVNYDGFKLILRGLTKNRTIKALKIGHNPLTTDGATAILQAVCDDRCRSLQYLDLSDVSVDSDFVTLLRKVQLQRQLIVKHGITLRHDDLRKGDVPVVLDTDDPVTILFELVKTKNLRLIDFLKNLDKDNSDTLSREELRRGLEEIDLPLSSRSMDLLMNKLDINRDGHVDFSELTLRYKEHVRRVNKLQREADVDLKHYKNFDRLQQLREAVRLRLTFSNAATQT